MNSERVAHAKRDLQLREKRQAEQRAIALEHRQHRAETIKAYTRDVVDRSLTTAQKMRAQLANEVRKEEEIIRAQIADQRSEWSQLGQDIHQQSTMALRLHDKSRKAVLKHNTELGRRGKKETEKCDRSSANLRAERIESNRQAAERVRTEAGFEMLKQTKEGLLSERIQSANDRRKQAQDGATIVAEMRMVPHRTAARRRTPPHAAARHRTPPHAARSALLLLLPLAYADARAGGGGAPPVSGSVMPRPGTAWEG